MRVREPWLTSHDMAEKPPEQSANDMPTEYGTSAALSSSDVTPRPDVLRPKSPLPGHIPVPPPKLSVPLPASDAQTSAGYDPSAGETLAGEPMPGSMGSSFRSASTYGASRAGLQYDDASLETGMVVAGRYEILETLGKGGMGSVYKARDQELNRLVALKVIRPELARNAAIVDRFKQELRLSHLVTHKNVIRMYDLGEDTGMRFITMEFVEGRDLRSIIEQHGKLPPAEAVGILQQICRALEAAHAVGILHRDLKPQNIMQDAHGRIVVMDFGLARTIEGDGMTQSGAMVGTMEYMSPEQALGKDLDQRSDIFALGLICYEMLTGDMPFRAESALASLIKRTQERAAAVTVHDPNIPGALAGIVSKCLERDVTQRYANIGEVLHDLEAWEGRRLADDNKRAAADKLRFHANVASAGLSGRWMLIVGSVVLLLALAITGTMIARRHSGAHTASQAAVTPAISLAIMPFYNATSDPSLDSLGTTLSDMLSTSIGQSASVRMVSPDRLHQVLQDLHITGHSEVDVATLRRLAGFANADTILFGRYENTGGQLQIKTTILDLAHDTQSVLTTPLPSQKDLLATIDTLAGQVREKLAANPDMLNDLKAHSARPSTNSVEALTAYDKGLAFTRTGNHLDAQKQFEAAIQADPAFALAYSKLAGALENLGHDDQAQAASRRAVELSDSLPAQEKYLIEADHARVNKDTGKAITAYEHLATSNPADADVQFQLASLYEQTSDFSAARHRLAAALTDDPKNVQVLLASGRVAIKSGDPNGGLEFLKRALTLAIQLDNQEEKAAILQATGIAYSMLNQPDEALRNYQQSQVIKQQIGDKRGAAASLEEIANIQDSTGHPDAALASYKEALATRREIGDQAGIANSLIDTGSFYHDHGKADDALKYFTDALQIARELGDESRQALCLSNIGSIRLDKGEYQEALTYLEQGYQLRQKLNVPQDLAQSLHNLAEAHTKLGQYDEALALSVKAIDVNRSMNDQRGVALESASMARLFAQQGRFDAALSSMQDALKYFQQSKEMTTFTADIFGGWGHLLSQVGRGDEGKPFLDNALNIAHQVKDDAAAARVMNWIGDSFYYKGDYFVARQQYDKALAVALKTTDRETILSTKINKAKVDMVLAHSSPVFKKLGEDADTLGLKPLSVACSFYLGEMLTANKDYSGARQAFDLALSRSEKLGLRILEARAQYGIAALLVQSGKANDATPHYREVVRILESISREDNTARILERADLQSIYRESTKGFQGNH